MLAGWWWLSYCCCWSVTIVMAMETLDQSSLFSNNTHNDTHVVTIPRKHKLRQHSSMTQFLQHIFSGNYESPTLKSANVIVGGSNESDDKNSTKKGNSSIDSVYLCTHIGSGIPCIDKRNLSQPPAQSILTKFESPSPAIIVTPTPTEETHTALPSVIPSSISSTKQPSNLPNTVQSLAPVTIEPMNLLVPVAVQPTEVNLSSSAPTSQEPIVTTTPTEEIHTAVPSVVPSSSSPTKQPSNLPNIVQSLAPVTNEPMNSLVPVTFQPIDVNLSSSAPASQEPNPSFVPITGPPYDFESLIPVTDLPTNLESSSPMTDEPYDTYAPATIEPKESNVPETSEPQTESLNLPLPTTTVSQDSVSERPIAAFVEDPRSSPVSSECRRPRLTWIPDFSIGTTVHASNLCLVMLSSILSMAILTIGS